MGQTGSNFLAEVPGILPDKLTEIRSKSKLLQELNQLTFEDFKKYIDEINDLLVLFLSFSKPNMAINYFNFFQGHAPVCS